MKRIIASFAVMAAVAVAAPAMAKAPTFTPAGSLVEFSGTLNVSQSIVSTTCSSAFAISIDSTGSYAGVAGSTFTGTSLCDGLVPSGYIWPVNITAPASGTATDLRIDNIYIKTSAGYCNGNVAGKWLSAGNGAMQFVSAQLPGKIKVGLIEVSAACNIDGTLTANVPVTISN